MAELTYTVVQHDGGWAYKVGDVFSEPYRTHDAAAEAARDAAARQRIPDHDEAILYQDGKGKWHEETAKGDDRPNTSVVE